MPVYKQKRFDGGIASDLRNARFNQAGNIEHFEVRGGRLLPRRSTEAVETKSLDIVKFAYAPNNTDYSLYGLGVDSGAIADVYEIDDADLTAASPTWGGSFPGPGTGARNELVWFHYKDYIYYWEGGITLARFGPLSGNRAINIYQSITYTDLAEPVHHPADDIAYFFHDNDVAKLNNTTFTDNALTLPTNLKIVSATAYGNYLAIACAGIVSGQIGNSIVFLWDRDSSLTTISHKYDLGEGDVKILANVGGELVAILDEYSVSAFAAQRSAVVIKKLVGGEFREVERIDFTTTGTALYTDPSLTSPCNKIETTKAVYFAMKAVRGNDTISGVWSYSDKGALTCEHIEEDDDGNGIQGFYKLGNYWWIAHSNDGSVNRTSDQSDFTFTSKYDTPIIGDGEKTYKLKGVSVFTEPLPAAGQIVSKYRKDEESSFSTIRTFTTDNDIRHSSGVDSNGDTLPHFKELQIRVESTGGAVITGIKVAYEPIEDDEYES